VTRPHPPDYRGPTDPARDAGQWMRDGTAERLLNEIAGLHDALLSHLDHQVHIAAIPPADPADLGTVTGTREHDQLLDRGAAVRQAQVDRDRGRRNALQQLRDVKRWYEERLGLRPPRRPRVESIDYRNNGGERRVG
jgi:hypothetical protein